MRTGSSRQLHLNIPDLVREMRNVSKTEKDIVILLINRGLQFIGDCFNFPRLLIQDSVLIVFLSRYKNNLGLTVLSVLSARKAVNLSSSTTSD